MKDYRKVYERVRRLTSEGKLQWDGTGDVKRTSMKGNSVVLHSTYNAAPAGRGWSTYHLNVGGIKFGITEADYISLNILIEDSNDARINDALKMLED